MFRNTSPLEKGWHNLVVIIGLLSFVSLFVSKYHRNLMYLAIPAGLALYGFAQWRHQELLVYQIFALLAAISAPVFATILIYEWLMKSPKPRGNAYARALISIILSSVVSLYGAVVVVSLLNDVIFVQYIKQFRGVKLLYIAPIILMAIYLLFDKVSPKAIGQKIITLYNQPILIKHVVLIAVAGVVAGYFLSRSGNNAVVSGLELEMRDWLNELFGVRPRTKELFIGHPFFLLASYLVYKYKKGSWLFILGVIGQMSMVSTFTHLHTPVIFSWLRTVYGLGGGIVLGLLLIVLVELVVRFIKKRERNEVNAN